MFCAYLYLFLNWSIYCYFFCSYYLFLLFFLPKAIFSVLILYFFLFYSSNLYFSILNLNFFQNLSSFCNVFFLSIPTYLRLPIATFYVSLSYFFLLLLILVPFLSVSLPSHLWCWQIAVTITKWVIIIYCSRFIPCIPYCRCTLYSTVEYVRYTLYTCTLCTSLPPLPILWWQIAVTIT